MKFYGDRVFFVLILHVKWYNINMKKYTFELLETTIPDFREKDYIFPAVSISDAIQKFARKHDLEPPAYWDEPTFNPYIEITFKNKVGSIRYKIYW